MLAMKAQPTKKRPSRQRLKIECFFGDAARHVLHATDIQENSIQNSDLPLRLTPSPSGICEHVAIGRDPISGRVVGLIAASRQLTSREPFLQIEQVVLDASYPTNAVLRRLVATVILRVAGMNGMPSALAMRSPSGVIQTTFLALARHFTGSTSYPPVEGAPIKLATVQLAKRVAEVVAPVVRYDVATGILRGARLAGAEAASTRNRAGMSAALDLAVNRSVTPYDELLLVIDLRSEQETVLIDDAREAYRRP